MADNKFLDASGVKVLYDLLSLQDYPNNDVLTAVINAIDETKANKIDTYNYPIVVNGEFSSGEEYQDLTSAATHYAGRKYCIIFDGVTFIDLIPEFYEDEYMNIGDNSTYPFEIVFQQGSNELTLRVQDNTVSHTYSIFVKQEMKLADIIPYCTNVTMLDEGDIFYLDSVDIGMDTNWYDFFSEKQEYYVSIDEDDFQIIEWNATNQEFSPYYHSDGRVTVIASNSQYNGNLHIWGEGNYDNYSAPPKITFGRFIKPINDIFIPDTIARMSDIPDISNLATTETVSSHIENTSLHLTDEERAIWNAKMNGDKIFIGTKAEYNTAYAAGEVPVGALVVLTDVD